VIMAKSDRDLCVGFVETSDGWVQVVDPYQPGVVRFDYTVKANGTFLGCASDNYTLGRDDFRRALDHAIGSGSYTWADGPAIVVGQYYSDSAFGECYVGTIAKDPSAILRSFGWN